jgi:hypothetical protein
MTTAQGDDGAWRDEDELLLDELNAAMATYSADGQVDDATGGDAGEEEEFSEGTPGGRPSPDGPGPGGHSGPV